ncbi:hypothetical protein LZC95_04090 [Pendulispora brunnea]|uniref:ABC transporter domain-containing protein n=1 Tax=Pendulispora brunnea TaxID=2905690 RepID=A0ABZ2KBI3_9BACT
MIELDHVRARVAPIGVGPVSLRLPPGITALQGTAQDGVALLLGVLAARVPAQGRVSVFGLTPDAARRAIAHVPLDAVLPDALRVSETLELARTLRGDAEAPPAAARLAELGLDALAGRRVRSLDPREVRAVAMAEALTSKVVRVILLEEPFATVDARALAVLPGLLRRRAKEGACIVIATASTRDARDLADQRFVFQHGLLVADASLLRPAELHVVSSDARTLAGALAREAAVTEVVASDQRVIVRGADPLALAHAVGQAVLASGVQLDSMRLEPSPPEIAP